MKGYNIIVTEVTKEILHTLDVILKFTILNIHSFLTHLNMSNRNNRNYQENF